MKRLTLLLLALAVAVSASAFDYGGSLDNTTGVERPVVDGYRPLVQRTAVALWAAARFGAWTLDAQGSYTMTLVPGSSTAPLAATHLFDLDRLALASSVPAEIAGLSRFGLTVGRSRFADVSGQVMGHTLDGLRLETTMPKSSFGFSAATTALLQKPTSRLVFGTLDALDLADPDKLFAPARLLVGIDYRMVDLVAGQTVTLGALVQEDLRRQDELIPVGTNTLQPLGGGHIDTQYASLVIGGGLAPGLFHRTYYTLNSGRRLEFVADDASVTGFSYQYQTILAHLAGSRLDYFRPELLGARASLFGQFSSAGFLPLAAPAYSDVLSLQPGNSAHIGVSLSVRPLSAAGLDILQTELKGVAYFRPSGTGPVSEGSVVPESDGSYVGTDINLALTAVPFSDLRLVLAGGVFVGNEAVIAASQNVDYQVVLQAVLRF